MALFKEQTSYVFKGNEFGGFPNKTLVLKGTIRTMVATKATPFANSPELKEIWLNPTFFSVAASFFTGMTGEVNVYFWNHTRDEIVSMAGNQDWLTGAGENIHFYFKDTIPADVEWPESLKPAT